MTHTAPGMLKIYKKTADAAKVDWKDKLCRVGKDNGTR